MGTFRNFVSNLYPKTRIFPERPYEFLGHPANIGPHPCPSPSMGEGKRERVLNYRRVPQGERACLRPTCPDEVGEAEFARASGRGLRRVKKFIQATKGICKNSYPLKKERSQSV
jgi:hypothetical protein